MKRKLTLLLDEKVISRAKEYAERNHQSLSGMVGKYFTFLNGSESSTKDETEFPEEISDLIGIVEVPDSLNVKDEYRKHRADRAIHE